MSAMAGFVDVDTSIRDPNEKAQMQAFLEAGYTTILSGGGNVVPILSHSVLIRPILTRMKRTAAVLVS
jgi:hypothetical protein